MFNFNLISIMEKEVIYVIREVKTGKITEIVQGRNNAYKCWKFHTRVYKKEYYIDEYYLNENEKAWKRIH